MFNANYNFLALTQLIFSFANALLLLKVFGTSDIADSFLIANAAIIVFQLIVTMPVEQVLYFYSNHKSQSVLRGHRFFLSAIWIAAISGITATAFAFSASDHITFFVAFEIDDHRRQLISKLIQILSFGLISIPILWVTKGYLNAHNKFSIPYIANLAPT